MIDPEIAIIYDAPPPKSQCGMPRRACCVLRFSLVYLLGAATAFGIVAIFLHKYGLIGEKEKPLLLQYEIDLGTLPIPEPTPNFLSVKLSFPQIPAASSYSPEKLVVSTLLAGDSWKVAGTTDYNEQREMVFHVTGLQPKQTVSVKYQVQMAGGRVSTSSSVLSVSTRYPLVPEAPILRRDVSTSNSLTFRW
jgi:hypothetical protein